MSRTILFPPASSPIYCHHSPSCFGSTAAGDVHCRISDASREPKARSVHPDFIISLEDGKRFKSLKRHLLTSYGMTPGEYRAKWNLPADHPMVAPNYAAARSELAKKMGLGRKRGTKIKPKRSRRK